MPKIPIITPRKCVKALKRAGFELERQSASGHAIYVNEAGRTVVVPTHPGDIPAPTMKSIIEQTGMTVDEFIGYL